MAEEQQEIRFSPYAEAAIEKLESEILQKYKMSLRDILTNPREYSDKPGITDSVTKMKKDVDDYFNSMKAEYAQEEASLNSELKRLDEIYKQIDLKIKDKSKELGIPYINPITIVRNAENEETIIIYENDDSVQQLIEKLVPTSVYVADISTEYKDYSIGFWLFSGPKTRVLSINPPVSPLIDIEAGHDELISGLDSVTALF